MARKTNTPTAPAAPEVDRDVVLAKMIDDIATGTSVRKAAEKHGIPYATAQRLLIGTVPDRYKAAQETGLIAGLAEAHQALEDARDHVQVSKAREQCRNAQWLLSNRLPHLFSPRQEITGAGGTPVLMDPLELARRTAFLLNVIYPQSGAPVATSAVLIERRDDPMVLHRPQHAVVEHAVVEKPAPDVPSEQEAAELALARNLEAEARLADARIERAMRPRPQQRAITKK